MEVHFIDVGCGNMTLIIFPDSSIIMYDCNITYDNNKRVLSYIRRIIGKNGIIDVFINSHRDADHMRGIKILHAAHTIKEIWDSGVAGTTIDSCEHRAYMDFRRTVLTREIVAQTYYNHSNVTLKFLNSKWSDYHESNDQSIVIKIEYKGTSVMLSGDTSYRPWKEKIVPFHNATDLKSSIFLAPHHGSLSFFDDPSDPYYFYISHFKKINPDMTLISVGPNSNNLPDLKAIELYSKYSIGSNEGAKVYSTQGNGTIKLVLKENGGWILYANQ